MAQRKIDPRDPYFADFDAGVAITTEIASLIETGCRGEALPSNLWPTVRSLQVRADLLVHGLHARLDHAFITPIEREDIHLLAVSIDDVTDALAGAVGRMDAYAIVRPTEPLRWFCAALNDMTGELPRAVDALRTLSPGPLREATERVDAVAVKVDEVFRDVLRDLSRSALEPYDLVRWKDVYDALHAASVNARRVARIARHVLVRHS